MGWWDSFEASPGLLIHMAVTRRGMRRLALQISPEQFQLALGRINSEPCWQREHHSLLKEARRQVMSYFSGQLKTFDLPLDLQGSPFQLKVWEALLHIPYGSCWSYADVASYIGAPRAYRAVGSANRANPIAIIVPCHRVISANGQLGGYLAGLEMKRKLLTLEAAL